MNYKNFSDVIIKLDGNTTRAVNKYVKKQKTSPIIYEYEDKANHSTKNYPFNQSSKDASWIKEFKTSEKDFRFFPETGRKKFNIVNKKTLDGIFTDSISNQKESFDLKLKTSKSPVKSKLNRANSSIDFRNSKKIFNLNDAYKNDLSLNNINLAREIKDRENERTFSNIFLRDSKKENEKLKLVNYDKINNKYKDFITIENVNSPVKKEKNTISNNYTQKTIKPNNLKPYKQTLTFIYERDEVNEKPKFNKFNGWITKDSSPFQPLKKSLLSKRKLTKSVDIASLRNNKEYAGVKTFDFRDVFIKGQTAEIKYYNYENLE